MNDVIDTLAGISGERLGTLRRRRPDVVKHLQGCDDAIFAPLNNGGFTRAEREAAALHVATLLRDHVLAEHYRLRLEPYLVVKPLSDTRGAAVLAHLERVTTDPESATKANIDGLIAAGLSPHAVVALSQLIAFVNFQSRVLAGLRMLKG